MNLEQSLNLDNSNPAFNAIESAIMRAVANTTGLYVRNLKAGRDGVNYELHIRYEDGWLMAWGAFDYLTAQHSPDDVYRAYVQRELEAQRDRLIATWDGKDDTWEGRTE